MGNDDPEALVEVYREVRRLLADAEKRRGTDYNTGYRDALTEVQDIIETYFD